MPYLSLSCLEELVYKFNLATGLHKASLGVLERFLMQREGGNSLLIEEEKKLITLDLMRAYLYLAYKAWKIYADARNGGITFERPQQQQAYNR